MPATTPPTDFLVSIADDGMVVAYRLGREGRRLQPPPTAPAAIGYAGTSPPERAQGAAYALVCLLGGGAGTPPPVDEGRAGLQLTVSGHRTSAFPAFST